MKNLAILFFCLAFYQFTIAQSVGVGTETPDSSAMLDVSSTTKGMLVPRMTTTQRATITSPATGLLVFDTNTNSFWFKGGTTWVELIDSSNTVVQMNGPDIYMGMAGNVGIGTNVPASKLEIVTNIEEALTIKNELMELKLKLEEQKASMGTTTNHALSLYANNNSNQFTLSPSGNVGINVNVAEKKLHVEGETYLNGNVGIGYLGALYPLSFPAAYGNKISLNGAAGNHFGIGLAAAMMQLYSDGPDSDIAFGIGHAGAFTERMRMKGSGRFGIGTPSPLQALHVIGNGILSGLFGLGGISSPLFPLHLSSGFGNKISLSGDPGSFFGFGVGAASMMQMITPVGGAIGFGTGNSDAFEEKMRITGEGKVGIGTETPVEKLDVDGNVNISGGLGVGAGVAVGGGLGVAGGLGVGGSVGIGTPTPDPSSILDMVSSSKGMLMPRMSSAQRQSINSPAEGLTVYDNSTKSPWYRTDDEWMELKGDSSSIFEQLVFRNSPEEIYMGMNERVGVGIQSPEYKLHIVTEPDSFGLVHTDGEVRMGTVISDDEVGRMGTLSNHPFEFFTNFNENQLELSTDGNVHLGRKLYMNSTQDTAKIVFHEVQSNNHQFTGFGYNQNDLRYQVENENKDHVFKAAINANQSKEIVRFKGNGKVGIGVKAPNNTVDIASGVRLSNNHPSNLTLYLTQHDEGNIAEFRNDSASQGIGISKNSISASGTNDDQDLQLSAKGDEGRLVFATNGNQRMFITGAGNVGIGTPIANAPLQFDNILANRKIVLYESSNNDNLFTGFGLCFGTQLRYQSMGEHIFFRGVDASTSTELMRLTADGRLGIGTNVPLAKLSVQGTTFPSHFSFSTDEHTYIRGGKAGSYVLLNDLGGGGVAVGTAVPLQKLHVQGNTYISDKLGIGVPSPNAPLQFPNVEASRKIVLYESANNDNQFYGLGINGGILRYQVTNTASNHVFYAGISSINSNELMRIKGDGNVGIGNTNPLNRLDVSLGTRTGTHPTGLPLYVTGNISDASNGVEIRHNNATQGIGFGMNTIYAAGSNTNQDLGLQAKGASGNLLLKTNSAERMRVTGNGNVGIGTTTPNAPLQFANGSQNRKIVLHEAANNDHQFFGFGIGGGEMRYQVNNPADHVFYASTSSSSSVELMRIKGDGNVDIAGDLNIADDVDIAGDLNVDGNINVGYQVVYQPYVVPLLSTMAFECECPAGFKVLGGGMDGTNELFYKQSFPDALGTSWIGAVDNPLPIDQSVTIYAICAKFGN